MVVATGIEPVTPTMSTWCSTAELGDRGPENGAKFAAYWSIRPVIAAVFFSFPLFSSGFARGRHSYVNVVLYR